MPSRCQEEVITMWEYHILFGNDTPNTHFPDSEEEKKCEYPGTVCTDSGRSLKRQSRLPQINPEDMCSSMACLFCGPLETAPRTMPTTNA
jgi:hypothetical protein